MWRRVVRPVPNGRFGERLTDLKRRVHTMSLGNLEYVETCRSALVECATCAEQLADLKPTHVGLHQCTVFEQLADLQPTHVGLHQCTVFVKSLRTELKIDISFLSLTICEISRFLYMGEKPVKNELYAANQNPL